LGGAAAPIAAQALSDKWGTDAVGLYLAAAGLVSLIGLVMQKQGRNEGQGAAA
jgi:hypothetical protein